MARVNSGGLTHDLPCNGLLAALTFVAALAMLAISLFWPYLLSFALSIEQASTSYRSLAIPLSGADIFVFPLMLLFTAIAALCSKSRPPAAKILTRSDRPTRSVAQLVTQEWTEVER